MKLAARPLVPGSACGRLLTLSEPLSFWGGYDPGQGAIVDSHHPQRGGQLAGAIVALPASRGSSSTSAVLAEAIRLRTAPAGLILARPDGILALGAIVAEELYGHRCPIVVAEHGWPFAGLDGATASIRSDPSTMVGEIEIQDGETET